MPAQTPRTTLCLAHSSSLLLIPASLFLHLRNSWIDENYSQDAKVGAEDCVCGVCECVWVEKENSANATHNFDN